MRFQISNRRLLHLSIGVRHSDLCAGQQEGHAEGGWKKGGVGATSSIRRASQPALLQVRITCAPCA